jgi:hypothetical protein
MGCIFGRHKSREALYEQLHSKTDYLIQEKTDFSLFKEIMERSVFSLCPRGYGKTSFRINEALNLGSIPVYIYDDPWIPFLDKISFDEYGILIHESQISNIDTILKNTSMEDIERLRLNGQRAYRDFYSYPGCFSKILEVVNER